MLTPISVVIPLHNRADLASQCLASLARWTTPLEILVVDDGSTDPGVELLRRAGLAHQWLRHPQALGFSAAVNRGLTQATGDPLLLLNSDAEVTEGGDHALRAALTEDSGGVADRRYRRRRSHRSRRSRRRASGLSRRPAAVERRRLSLAALALRAGERTRSRGALQAAPRSRRAASPAASSTGPRAPPWRCRAPPSARSGRSTRPTATMPRISTTADAWRAPAAACASSPTGSSCTTSGSLGQASGDEGQQLDLLWLDLLHWARRHRGAAWARRARAALLAGGRLRLLRLARRRGEQRGDRRARRPWRRSKRPQRVAGGRRSRRRMTAAG